MSAAATIPTARLGSLKYDDVVDDFSAVGVDGRDVKLSSFKGKPVLVAFWTGARSPGDDLAKLAATYKDQGLAVWAVNVGTERAEFDTWAKANAAALGYTVAWDAAGKAFMEAQSYMKFGVGMYPAFLVVNADGKFRGGLIGMGPKIAGWARQSLDRAGLKLTTDDKAAVLRRAEGADGFRRHGRRVHQAHARRRQGGGAQGRHARRRRGRAGLHHAHGGRQGDAPRRLQGQGRHPRLLGHLVRAVHRLVPAHPEGRRQIQGPGRRRRRLGHQRHHRQVQGVDPEELAQVSGPGLCLRPARARCRHLRGARLQQALPRHRHPDAVRDRPRRQDRRHHRRQRRRGRHPHRGRARPGRREGGRRHRRQGPLGPAGRH
jgi:peroxiredoxin